MRIRHDPSGRTSDVRLCEGLLLGAVLDDRRLPRSGAEEGELQVDLAGLALVR